MIEMRPRIACLDVQYEDDRSTVATVVWREGIEWYGSHRLPPAAPYEPGRFYLRELPCLLEMIGIIPERCRPDLYLIDGFVETAPGVAGLGLHLYRALSPPVPVIGVGKTKFVTAPSIEVSRFGRAPIFVSAVGIEAETAGDMIRSLPGEYRIPDLIRWTDQLARGHHPQGWPEARNNASLAET